METAEATYLEVDQHNTIKERWFTKLKRDPERYAEYRRKDNERRRLARARRKERNPEKYKAYLRSRAAHDRTTHLCLMCRIPLDEGAELRRVAKERGVSIAEMIRTYVTWGLEQDT